MLCDERLIPMIMGEPRDTRATGGTSVNQPMNIRGDPAWLLPGVLQDGQPVVQSGSHHHESGRGSPDHPPGWGELPGLILGCRGWASWECTRHYQMFKGRTMVGSGRDKMAFHVRVQRCGSPEISFYSRALRAYFIPCFMAGRLVCGVTSVWMHRSCWDSVRGLLSMRWSKITHGSHP